MAVFNSFSFDNINSLNEGIYITGEAVYNAPERIVQMVSVPGRNGSIAIDEGHFNNIIVTYPAGAFGTNQSDFADKIATIRNKLVSRYTYKRLTDTYNPSEFRMGLYYAGLEVAPAAMASAGQFNIQFDCKPQRWLVSGETPQTFTASGSITNPTLFPARPLLAVTGAGNLTVGTQTMTLIARTNPASILYIDCESQEAWEIVGGVMVSRNDYVQNAGSDFPSLLAGSNVVTLGTGISKVDITPRWWKI